MNSNADTVEPLLRSHPDERPAPLERSLDNVNLNMNVFIYTLNKKPPLMKGHFSYAKGVASQEGFHCTIKEISSLNPSNLSMEALVACLLKMWKLIDKSCPSSYIFTS